MNYKRVLIFLLILNCCRALRVPKKEEYSDNPGGCSAITCTSTCGTGGVYMCMGFSGKYVHIIFNTSLFVGQQAIFVYTAYPNHITQLNNIRIFVNGELEQTIQMTGCPRPEQRLNITITNQSTYIKIESEGGYTIVGDKDCDKTTSETYLQVCETCEQLYCGSINSCGKDLGCASKVSCTSTSTITSSSWTSSSFSPSVTTKFDSSFSPSVTTKFDTSFSPSVITGSTTSFPIKNRKSHEKTDYTVIIIVLIQVILLVILISILLLGVYLWKKRQYNTTDHPLELIPGHVPFPERDIELEGYANFDIKDNVAMEYANFDVYHKSRQNIGDDYQNICIKSVV